MIVAFAVMIALPWFGSAFNGFTFPGNRFSFAWGLFLALGAALLLSEDRPLARRDILAACAVFVLYVVPIWVLGRPLPPLIAAPMAVGAATLVALAAGAHFGRRDLIASSDLGCRAARQAVASLGAPRTGCPQRCAECDAALRQALRQHAPRLREAGKGAFPLRAKPRERGAHLAEGRLLPRREHRAGGGQLGHGPRVPRHVFLLLDDEREPHRVPAGAGQPARLAGLQPRRLRRASHADDARSDEVLPREAGSGSARASAVRIPRVAKDAPRRHLRQRPRPADRLRVRAGNQPQRIPSARPRGPAGRDAAGRRPR